MIRANAFPFDSPKKSVFQDEYVEYKFFRTGNLNKAQIDFDIQTELTSAIMDRMLSGVQLWSQDQVTGLMGSTSELVS